MIRCFIIVEKRLVCFWSVLRANFKIAYRAARRARMFAHALKEQRQALEHIGVGGIRIAQQRFQALEPQQRHLLGLRADLARRVFSGSHMRLPWGKFPSWSAGERSVSDGIIVAIAAHPPPWPGMTDYGGISPENGEFHTIT